MATWSARFELYYFLFFPLFLFENEQGGGKKPTEFQSELQIKSFQQESHLYYCSQTWYCLLQSTSEKRGWIWNLSDTPQHSQGHCWAPPTQQYRNNPAEVCRHCQWPAHEELQKSPLPADMCNTSKRNVTNSPLKSWNSDGCCVVPLLSSQAPFSCFPCSCSSLDATKVCWTRKTTLKHEHL